MCILHIAFVLVISMGISGTQTGGTVPHKGIDIGGVSPYYMALKNRPSARYL